MRLDRERRTAVPTACPFVAFAEERDLRAPEPDHNHRCYAESPPAPRALAHQERYCLSASFPSCPIFQDWAVQSAAHEVDDRAPSLGPPAAQPSGAALDMPGLFDEPVSATTAASDPAAGQDAEEDVPVSDDSDEYVGTARVAPWERPRRRQTFPRLRRPSAGIPPLVAGVVLLAVAAALLFLLPGFVAGLFSGPGAVATASPTPVALETPAEPTPEPAPTPLVYEVRSGDTLTKIARKFDVTLEELLAANPQIKNPNKIAVGDAVIIPTAPPEGEASASPAP